MTGSEPLIAAAISGIAVPVFQSILKGSGSLLGLFGKTLDENTKQIIFQASKKYAQTYANRHGLIKVLGMREPRNLESIYTAVQFLREEELQLLTSVEDLERAYRQAKRRSFQSKNKNKVSGLKVANEKQYLMVLGGPGTGKSTFLRRIGLEALRSKSGRFKHHLIPVFIELKEFRYSDVDIENKISDEFKICGFPESSRFTAKALEQGRLLILLDGLDEVPTDQTDEVIRKIQNFVDLYDKNHFITSCRVAAYRRYFRRFTDVAIAEFDDEQIETFITYWFENDPEASKDCWGKLNRHENSAAKELTQTPLLLTLICLLYQRARKFPANRATLFEKALRVLLEEWAGEKGIPQEDVYKGLDTRLKETLLSEIAYNAFKSNRLFLPRREVASQVQKFLEEVIDEKRIDGENVLESIEIQHGVIVERAEGIYSFSHLTLQEYLTAQYIDDNRQIQSLVIQHLTDSRWQEVFLLVAGLMRGGADELLILMTKKAQSLGQNLHINTLLQWADQITDTSEGQYKSAAKRAAALYLAHTLIEAKNIVLEPAKVSSSITLMIAYKLLMTRDSNRDVIATYALDITSDLGLDLVQAFTENMDFGYISYISKGLAERFNTGIEIIQNLFSRAIKDDDIVTAIKNTGILNGADFPTLIIQLNALLEKDSSKVISPEQLQKLFQETQQVWLGALKLRPEIVNFSEQDSEALRDYLYANRLILNCRQAAVRVSKKTWETIEEQMLMPKS
ncbi:MAG: NACHT domain-containing protein [Leptolyngbya sp. SIO1D8]|nr:NACHT domain-containing protein [Leptolyngbya sp. SIO1D8]